MSLFPGRWNSLHSGTGFLRLGLCILSLLMIFMWSGVLDLVLFIMLSLVFIIVSVTSFIRLLSTVVMRRFEGGGTGFGRTPWCIPLGGFVQIWFPQLHFFSVSLILRLVVLGCLLIQLGLMRNSERPGSFLAKGGQPRGIQ